MGIHEKKGRQLERGRRGSGLVRGKELWKGGMDLWDGIVLAVLTVPDHGMRISLPLSFRLLLLLLLN
jgi:hypothetical protein